jgi:carbonic anhydrase
MTTTEQLLQNANAYAEGFDKGDLPLPPGKRVAVLACMDARLNPYGILGLTEGDAHVIQRRWGRFRRRDPLAGDLAEPAGNRGDHPHPSHRLRDAHLYRRRARREARAGDRRAARLARPLLLRRGRGRARRRRTDQSSPFIPRTDRVRGFVYEVETGGLREVS